MDKIVLASNNAGKVREINELLKTFDINVVPQGDYDVDSVEETGLTFVENAIIKARYAALKTGLPAIADDSGIEVDALKGAPGIYSARFSGEGASDKENNKKLLEDLKDVPEAERTARYQCVMVFMRHAADPTPIIASGSWEGTILESPKGSGGFGYDPLFYVATHQCSAAELSAELKNKLSHRSKALISLLHKLQEADL
ncbi:MAG: RdgB/HAM1 family non-canonical purine NTP pyrophosphatase [Gammaproteobacteria bacterium]|nr:RdgB/HAM1 family non-canonical purine NTP pyrophosphatase [Gammaproteobacteria bacterium]